MHNYFKDKLRSKLDIIAKSKGVSPYEIGDIDYNKLEFGCYEIIWKTFKSNDEWLNKVVNLRNLNTNNYRVEFGHYFIDKEINTFSTTRGKAFTSSQFIHFDIREYREKKLNELLK